MKIGCLEDNFKNIPNRSSHCGSAIRNPTGDVGRTLASPSGLKTWCCGELWCMSQTRLGSGIALIQPLALELTHAAHVALQRQKNKTQKNPNRSSLMGQYVMDLALLLKRLGALMWLGFDSWPGNIHMPWAGPKKKKKERERRMYQINSATNV